MSDLIAARSFMAGRARVLDRRRFELLFDSGAAEPVLAALNAYRNPDCGYGHGLEPDLRAPESQPAAAFHAFEVFADLVPVRRRTVRALSILRDNAIVDPTHAES